MTAHRPRILVIDDEPQIHRFLGPALEAAGYESERADTALAGLSAIARRAPDAVLLDSTNMTLEEAVQAAEAIVDAKLDSADSGS